MKTPEQPSRRALRHIPFRPVRKGIHGERIYLRLWQERIAADPDFVFWVFPQPLFILDQRGAQVAASFMVMMGCNVGYAFTEQAERMAVLIAAHGHWGMSGRTAAFLASWAISNARNAHVNDGLILAESILSRRDLYQRDAFSMDRVLWPNVPTITQRDYDVLECMVKWWATEEATALRKAATAETDAMFRKSLFGTAPINIKTQGT